MMMARLFQLVVLASHVVAQSASATSGNSDTVTATSAVPIKTSLEFSVEGELALVQRLLGVGEAY